MSSMTAKPGDLVPMYASTPGSGGPGSIGGGGSLLTGGYPGRTVPPPVGTPGGGPNATPTTGLPGPIESNMYGPSLYAAAAAAAQAYLPFAASESSAFYPHHINGDSAVEAWRNFSAAHAHHAAAAWAYDPTVINYPYGAGYGALDVRRKNATRESTSTLKAWLYEHIKNPYPTKGEKIMLAIITKMTLTQVSTWFANARRRLKKENKMQWSPRNRTGDDDDDDDDNKNIGSDLDDDVMDGRRTPRTICDDSDDIDVGVDTANDDSQSAHELHDSRLFGQPTSGLDDRHTEDCPPHCSLLRHRLHFTSNGLLAGSQPPQHNRGFFWNHSATAASTKSNITDDEDDDVIMNRKRRHASSSSLTSPPPPLIAAIDFATRRVPPAAQSSASASLRDEVDRRTVAAAVSGSSSSNNNNEDRRHSKTATEKPRIWSIADVATSGTSNGRQSSSPGADSNRTSVDASGLPEVESAAATVTSGFQPWTSSAMVDPLSPHHQGPHHPLLNPFRVCIPPPPPSNGLQHQLRYGSFPVGGGPPSASSSHPAIASHQAALAHQLAAAAAQAAAIHHVRIQQHRQQQQQQQQQQNSPPLIKRELSSSSSMSLQLSPVIGSSRTGTRSPPSNGVDDRRTATTTGSESKHQLVNGGTARSISSPVGDDIRDVVRKTPDRRTPETYVTSRDGSPLNGATVNSCLAPTAFKPLPPRRL